MLTELSVVEQRYLAVREALDGARITDVAIRYGVDRRTITGGSSATPPRDSAPSPIGARGRTGARTRSLPRSRPGSWPCAGPTRGGARGPSCPSCAGS